MGYRHTVIIKEWHTDLEKDNNQDYYMAKNVFFMKFDLNFSNTVISEETLSAILNNFISLVNTYSESLMAIETLMINYA